LENFLFDEYKKNLKIKNEKSALEILELNEPKISFERKKYSILYLYFTYYFIILILVSLK